MKRYVALLGFVLWILAGMGGLRAETERHMMLDDGQIRILVEEPNREWAGMVQRIYPRAKEEIERTLGWRLLSRPTIILMGDEEAFEQRSGSPLIKAYALPERHIIVMGRAILTAEPYLLNVTFKHELCHLLLHDHIEGARLPRWLDEGVCQWVSGSLGEILFNPLGSAAVRVNLSRNAIPLHQLTHSFPSGENQLLLAYEESRSFVDYLSARYGSDALLDILNRLKEGHNIHEAVSKSLSISLDALEKDWVTSLGNRNIWIIWIGQYMYEVLFLLAGLLTIAASIRLMLKKRRYEAEEEDERKEIDD